MCNDSWAEEEDEGVRKFERARHLVGLIVGAVIPHVEIGERCKMTGLTSRTLHTEIRLTYAVRIRP